MIEIRLPEIKPGEYELEIEALDEKTLARSIVRNSLSRNKENRNSTNYSHIIL